MVPRPAVDVCVWAPLRQCWLKTSPRIRSVNGCGRISAHLHSRPRKHPRILFLAPCDGDWCVSARGIESGKERAKEAAAVAVSPCLPPGYVRI
ncbi:hypothetical protein NDU88_001495 [Pleurodeles waltl]|uniref:Uncharacterized protein n=1 Tax=Pleurodeles waltl TaxID=8319 RepID=A0AAV7WM48_PLEWA|nr:hypothetical protein NDU88_001495 [Pleurodeles waltl]